MRVPKPVIDITSFFDGNIAALRVFDHQIGSYADQHDRAIAESFVQGLRDLLETGAEIKTEDEIKTEATLPIDEDPKSAGANSSDSDSTPQESPSDQAERRRLEIRRRVDELLKDHTKRPQSCFSVLLRVRRANCNLLQSLTAP
jgi:hypothetical protein